MASDTGGGIRSWCPRSSPASLPRRSPPDGARLPTGTSAAGQAGGHAPGRGGLSGDGKPAGRLQGREGILCPLEDRQDFKRSTSESGGEDTVVARGGGGSSFGLCVGRGDRPCLTSGQASRRREVNASPRQPAWA